MSECVSLVDAGFVMAVQNFDKFDFYFMYPTPDEIIIVNIILSVYIRSTLLILMCNPSLTFISCSLYESPRLRISKGPTIPKLLQRIKSACECALLLLVYGYPVLARLLSHIGIGLLSLVYTIFLEFPAIYTYIMIKKTKCGLWVTFF